MKEQLQDLLEQMGSTRPRKPKSLNIICFDTVHNRTFNFLDFHDNLDPSNFSEGSFDLIISIMDESDVHHGGFRICELPNASHLCWLSAVRGSETLHKQLIQIILLISTYFEFKYILSSPDILKFISLEVIQEFKRLIDIDLKPAVLYINLSK